MTAPKAEIIWRISQYDSLESTSLTLQDLCGATDVAPHGLVVRAKQQSAGRGRLGRVWSSPPGHVYQSLIVQPKVPISQCFGLAFVTAIAVHNTLIQYGIGPDRLALKWPNDVLLDGKKVAGILVESGPVRDNYAAWFCIGVGINVAPRDDIPENWATLNALNPDHAVEAIADGFLHHFEAVYHQWVSEGFVGIRELWIAKSNVLGQMVTAGLYDQRVTGLFQDVDMTGALVLETPEGETHRISTGEVSLVPRAGHV